LLSRRADAAGAHRPTKDTSIVWLWLQYGAPHIETFDPKMQAPAGYRSMVGACSTSVPGVEFGGLLPGLSQNAERLAVVRSFHHTNSDHLGAAHYVLTAVNAPPATTRQTSPSFGSIAAKVRGVSHPVTGAPTFVRVSHTVSFDFDQPLWLGAANAPFDATGDSRQNLNLLVDAARLGDRNGLRRGLDRLRRDTDQSGAMSGLDSFSQQALDLILGQAGQAFDVAREDARVRERYGPGLGEQLLSARRLCEAGCGFVTVNYGWAPNPADTPFAWDTHLGPSQPGVPAMDKQLNSLFPMLDRAVAAFIEEVAERGLSEKILLVITGDFGRTPKINEWGGRDHWPGLSTLALAGGGLRMGQVVGTSSEKAEFPLSSPVEPKDLMATLFHVLGIDMQQQYADFSGRPQYLLPDHAKPIAELI
jgi:hypothetical protein